MFDATTTQPQSAAIIRVHRAAYLSGIQFSTTRHDADTVRVGIFTDHTDARFHAFIAASGAIALGGHRVPQIWAQQVFKPWLETRSALRVMSTSPRVSYRDPRLTITEADLENGRAMRYRVNPNGTITACAHGTYDEALRGVETFALYASGHGLIVDMRNRADGFRIAKG